MWPDILSLAPVQPGVTYYTGFWLGDGSPSSYGNLSTISVDGTPILLTVSYQLEPGYQFVSGVFITSDPNPVINFHITGSGEVDAGFSFDDFCVAASAATCANAYVFQSIVYPGDNFTKAQGINNAAMIAG
jgi:hypothetical protein